MYIVYTVKKDGYMEQYTQMIGKNVYAVRVKYRYLIVRKNPIISFFIVKYIGVLKDVGMERMEKGWLH